jgi:glycosyltransferase involved in cell wall biosynthesis
MRIAVDALSVTNLSARRVLLGHLKVIAAAHEGKHSFIVLYHKNNQDLIRNIGNNVSWFQCPSITQNWAGRFLWQISQLPKFLRQKSVDLLISPNGSLAPVVSIPQVILGQNPWCFISDFHDGWIATLKGYLQRKSYRATQRYATRLFFNSNFIADLYARNSKRNRRPEPLLLNGIDEEVFAAGQPTTPLSLRNLEIVTVSVMTPHKDIETLLNAFALLHARGTHADLQLVGPWADYNYLNRIKDLIKRLALNPWVTIHGRVSDDALHGFYRRARLFALLSRCESFGLPAVEAQAFGTPCVVADVGAPPEIAGPGGLVVPPDDPQAAALAMERLLIDDETWSTSSSKAVSNAERFRWKTVSAPLVEYLSSDRVA